MVQFGVNGQPSVSANYLTPAGQIDNDLAANVTLQSNTRGYITYGAEYNSDNMAVNRTTEIFINYVNNSRLDANGFIPFGFVDEQGMKAVDQIYSGYGEMADICEGAAHTGNGNVSSSCIYPYGPWSSLLYSEGNAYLNANYSKMDYVRSARVRKETTGIDWRVLLGLSIVLVALVVTICWMLYLNKKNEQMFRNDINGDETAQDETGNRVPQYDPLAEDDDTGSPFLSTNFEEL
jgi:hypothetical protein